MGTLDALSVVDSVAGHAGVASIHAAADTVRKASFAMLKVEELSGSADVVGDCRGGEGEEEEKGEGCGKGATHRIITICLVR